MDQPPEQRSRLKAFLQRWAINTLAVLLAAYVVPSIRYERPLDLFVASLLLGIFNAFLKPLMWLLSLPLMILSLGLFNLVINAALLYFTGYLLRPRFEVQGFWPAFWGALIISVVSIALNILTGTGDSRLRVNIRRGGPKPPDRKDDGGGSGPVIDV
jgi:putative membrane protein